MNDCRYPIKHFLLLHLRFSILICIALILPQVSMAEANADFFEKKVFPIFQAHCIECHGETVQQGKLRLDAKAAFLQGGMSGQSIKANDTGSSILYQRITQDSPKPLMPMGKPPLTADEINAIAAWINAGAEWTDGVGESVQTASNHWAFEKVTRPNPPENNGSNWGNHPIDAFILSKLNEHYLKPSPNADKAKLIRRMYLDVIGLPPSLDELDRYLLDNSKDWEQRLMDDLLASPHYGEKWGRHWLDAARYADTNGYEKDRPREIWAYRDYVINSLNADKPFDQFTIEQLAGDLLPNAGLEQKIATGFHRNTMHNEEGGVDVEEFRFESLVDRINTASTVFLGLTMACAQCHAHKFEPISQQEYYRFFAYLNDCDEVSIKLPNPEITQKQREIETEIQQFKSQLASHFPAYDERIEWSSSQPQNYIALNGSVLLEKEGWIHTQQAASGTQKYLLLMQPSISQMDVLRITTQDKLNRDDIRIHVEMIGGNDEKKKLEWSEYKTDENQPLIQDNETNLYYALPAQQRLPENARLFINIESGTALSPFQVQVGYRTREPLQQVEDVEKARHERLEKQFALWLDKKAKEAKNWQTLSPVKMEAQNHTLFKTLPDQSLLADADMPNNDVYTVWYTSPLQQITALQLTMLRHPDLPDHGPGRGTVLQDGNFMLSEITLEVVSSGNESTIISFASASATSNAKNATAGNAIDGDRNTGWSIIKHPLHEYQATFTLKEPLSISAGSQLKITFDQNYIHTYTMGRFRMAATNDGIPKEPTGLIASLENALASSSELSPYYVDQLKQCFLENTPELENEQQQLIKLYDKIPKANSTLVVQKRDVPRMTHLYHRGEFLNPRETVEPGVPAILHPIHSNPNELPRLQMARWIASKENPLIARVTVNRIWYHYFGRGIVNTIDDFGTRGDQPTHPQLLDWLASELMDSGWSLKHIHRLILSSAVYQQSSSVTPEHIQIDPVNEWYARLPRNRVDAELIRDLALQVSGLLHTEIGGPSVFPPIPNGLGALSYGGLNWNTSEGKDRFRRGLYTYWKRTNPYPMLTTFDAPLADTTCVRRNRSNTPLQALTLLNDAVFLEASSALARRIMTESKISLQDKMKTAFRLCTSRIPTDEETHSLMQFYGKQYLRITRNEINPLESIRLDDESKALDQHQLAAWTMVARVLLNLDETITKE